MRASNVFVSVATIVDGGYIICTPSAGLTETLLVIFSIAASFILDKTEIAESTESHFMYRFFQKIGCTYTVSQLFLKLPIF